MNTEMMPYSSLIAALLISLVYGGLKGYNTYQRDWCGLRLLIRVLIARLPSLIIICILYFEIMSVASLEYLRRYVILISFMAVIIAEHFTSRILSSLQPAAADTTSAKHGMSISVPQRIAAKKLEIVDHLERDPRCKQILCDIVSSSSLSARKMSNIVRQLKDKPTRDDIFKVINAVGVAHAKGVLRTQQCQSLTVR